MISGKKPVKNRSFILENLTRRVWPDVGILAESCRIWSQTQWAEYGHSMAINVSVHRNLVTRHSVFFRFCRAFWSSRKPFLRTRFSKFSRPTTLEDCNFCSRVSESTGPSWEGRKSSGEQLGRCACESDRRLFLDQAICGAAV